MPLQHRQRLRAQPVAQAASAAAAAAAAGSDQKRRVVVTGTGVVSALGHEVDAFYEALLAGHSGISRIEVRSIPACPGSPGRQFCMRGSRCPR